MFHELTGYPHDSKQCRNSLRLQLRQARLAKKKPTWLGRLTGGNQIVSKNLFRDNFQYIRVL